MRSELRVFASAWLMLGLAPFALQAGTTPKVGGPGGTKTATAECPSPEFATAVSVRRGTYVHSIQLDCGKLTQGTTSFTRYSNVAGPTGGGAAAKQSCKRPAGAVIGIMTKADVYIDQIKSIQCDQIHEGSPRYLLYKSERHDFNSELTGGVDQDARCPSGEVLYKVTVKYGLWMDSLQGYCRKP